jgi:hypothetical protein
MVGGGLRRGFKRGNSSGGVKALTWHFYAETGRYEVVGSDEGRR